VTPEEIADRVIAELDARAARGCERHDWEPYPPRDCTGAVPCPEAPGGVAHAWPRTSTRLYRCRQCFAVRRQEEGKE